MKIHSGVASLTSLLLLVPVPGYAAPPVKAPPFAAYVHHVVLPSTGVTGNLYPVVNAADTLPVRVRALLGRRGYHFAGARCARQVAVVRAA